jgi:hypothetical protein
MKCVKTNDGKIVRISDQQAGNLVDNKKGKYCSKSEWKKNK